MNTIIISGSVGAGGANKSPDVKIVQMLLNNWLRKNNKQPLKVDGIVGPKTLKEITDYQKTLGSIVDSRVDSQGATIKALFSLQIQLLMDGISKDFVEMAKVSLYRNPRIAFPISSVDLVETLTVYLNAVKQK